MEAFQSLIILMRMRKLQNNILIKEILIWLLSEMEKAARLRPNDPQMYYNLGAIYYNKKNLVKFVRIGRLF